MFEKKSDDDTILQLVKDLQYPLVVKPTVGRLGKDTFTHIENEEALLQAIQDIRETYDYDDIIVEQHVKGTEYRLYVLDNQVAAIAKRVPANVVGNGRDTIEELIRLKNKERISNYKSIWRRVNSDKVNISNQRRKARLRELPHDFTASEEKEMLNYFRNTCCLSGSKENIQLDHALPLSKGGGTIKQNMIPLNATLNASKMDSNLFEWYENNKERFNLSDEKFYKTIKYLADMNDMDIDDYVDYYNEKYVGYVRSDYHLQ